MLAAWQRLATHAKRMAMRAKSAAVELTLMTIGGTSARAERANSAAAAAAMPKDFIMDISEKETIGADARRAENGSGEERWKPHCSGLVKQRGTDAGPGKERKKRLLGKRN